MIYRSVFNMNIRHAYFLDEGEEVFSDMPDDEKYELLRKYRLSDYLKIVPTAATKHIIKGHRLLFKAHSQGFRVVSKVIGEPVAEPLKFSPLIFLQDDLNLTFGLYINDAYFENYTQIADKGDPTLYLFSNVRPTTEDVGFANIFTADGSIDPDFLLREESTRHLVHNIALEDKFFGSGLDRFSIANIAATDIDSPESIDLINQHIKSKKYDGLVGYVRLTIKGDDNNHLLEFDDSDSNNIKQYILPQPPEFNLSFKNRKTFWRYIGFNEDSVLTTDTTKPLVKNGFVQIESSDFDPAPTEDKHYPNPTILSIKKEDSNYYSEIFI